MATEATFMLFVEAAQSFLKSENPQIKLVSRWVLGGCTLWSMVVLYLVFYAKTIMTTNPRAMARLDLVWNIVRCRPPIGAVTLLITVALMVTTLLRLPNQLPICVQYLVILCAVIVYGSTVSWRRSTPELDHGAIAKFLSHFASPPSWCLGVATGLLTNIFMIAQDSKDIDRETEAFIFKCVVFVVAILMTLLLAWDVYGAVRDGHCCLFLFIALVISVAVVFCRFNETIDACYMLYASTVLIEMRKNFLDPYQVIEAVVELDEQAETVMEMPAETAAVETAALELVLQAQREDN